VVWVEQVISNRLKFSELVLALHHLAAATVAFAFHSEQQNKFGLIDVGMQTLLRHSF